MQIIPVIDVRHGLAVRAVRGDRSNYRPIVTPLSASADPVDVVRGYMRLFGSSGRIAGASSAEASEVKHAE